jgi:NAD(P)-dependent dehydrogenase (short-subunit alcohol dehydrogenase family)
MSSNFEGKVALVTGASAGIGRATAIAFAKAGAKVVVAARRPQQGEETAQLVHEQGREAIFVKADVAKSNEVEALMKTIAERFGRLDCAFNNAGISAPTTALGADINEQEWDDVIDINLKGIWLCMKYEIPLMLKHGSGAIVNMSSVLGLVGTSLGVSPYVASKHGVLGLTKAIALEYAKQGLRINAVCPGFVETSLIEVVTVHPGVREQLDALHPIGRIGVPDEVAGAVTWLCSDAASFITGHSLVIDGGYIEQ